MKSHMWWVADRSTNPISAPGGKGCSLPAALLLSLLPGRLAACNRKHRTGNQVPDSHNQFIFRGSFCLLALAGVPFQIPTVTSRQFQIAIVGLAGALLLLAVIAWLRRRAMLKDYQEIADDVRVISKSLKGKIYRKSGDLRLKGRYHRWPVFVKFSNSLQAPGLHIRIPVPTRLTLFLIPRKLQEKNRLGKTVVPTSDPMFDSRFATRSDQPVQAQGTCAAAGYDKQGDVGLELQLLERLVWVCIQHCVAHGIAGDACAVPGEMRQRCRQAHGDAV